ncbi:hypothetical protein PoB_002340900 [Plakobranchus ocellatus]|uniref:Uncharacterized protein n=1 Tax=Plakobranchus ocellatus TaxID=259542 RepID=A0AAV3ZR59_9GAST|nr:hypothetical protein PoB_002340900 [Plakobranchus ocellatus]
MGVIGKALMRGIQGNENVDKLAKAALKGASSSGKFICYPDLKPKINTYINSVWQKNWDAEGANKLHEVLPNLGEDLHRRGEGAGRSRWGGGRDDRGSRGFSGGGGNRDFNPSNRGGGSYSSSSRGGHSSSNSTRGSGGRDQFGRDRPNPSHTNSHSSSHSNQQRSGAGGNFSQGFQNNQSAPKPLMGTPGKPPLMGAGGGNFQQGNQSGGPPQRFQQQQASSGGYSNQQQQGMYGGMQRQQQQPPPQHNWNQPPPPQQQFRAPPPPLPLGNPPPPPPPQRM